MKNKLLLFILFCATIIHSYAQNRTITGEIVDAVTSNAISGVSIKAEGSNFVAQSDAQGKFSIDLNQQTTTLLFTYIGYKSQQVTLGTSNKLTIALQPSAADLEEVVVVGYGTQTRKNLTGSTTTVKMNDLDDVALPTIESALQGRASGVFVNTSSGKLGQALQIRVRGISSISANNQPLFVIDGVPIISRSMGTYEEPDNPLAAISPEDIESMDVLKDAAAAAIYGARASNGVVLITTKKGKSGRTNIDLSYYGGSSEATKKAKFLNAAQYRELMTASVTNAGYIGNSPDQYANMSEFWEDWTGNNDWDENHDADWSVAGLRKGSMQQLGLNISGGDAKTRFVASASHNDNKGIIVGNRFVRTSGRLALDHNIYSWLDIGGNININKIDNYRVSSDNAFSNPLQLNALSPLQPIRRDGVLNNYTIYYNNLIDLENGKNLSNTYRTFANTYLSAKIPPI